MLARTGFPPQTTFAELRARSGVTLVLTGYNVLRTSTEAFDHVTHPDMAVLLAARITISIPLYFRPVEFDGQIYIDGGVLEPTPVRFCRRKARSLVVTLTCPSYSARAPAPPPMPLQMTDYVDLLFRGPGRLLHRQCLRMRKRHPRNVLEIDLGETGDTAKSRFLDLGMDNAEKVRLFKLGASAAERFASAAARADAIPDVSPDVSRSASAANGGTQQRAS
jgi:predicted acylesterase/phospholipase RssA